MTQGSYIPESTQDLIRRAERILEGVPVLDLTNPQFPTYTPAYIHPASGQIRSLAGSCHSITVKNVITIDDSSIIICIGSGTGTCGSIPATCPAGPLTPSDYVNMVATVTAQVAQAGVDITFKYLLNDVPTTTVRTVALLAGSNTIYAFPGGNVQYSPDTTLVLYGAEVTKY